MSSGEDMKSEVAEFYNGRTLFITGASGFMGKVLLEKLLYSCPGVARIYILMRPKRGKTVDARTDEMFKLPMFQRLMKENPDASKKIVPLEGDVNMEKLGLSENAKQHIISEVSVVIHGAATLRLEAKLKDAITMNVHGTARVLDICKNIKNLKAFIHVSTAFCHCDTEVMEERVYDVPVLPEDVMRITEWMDDSVLDIITPRLLQPHPNTYTYSKRLAEQLVKRYYPQMPVVIVRPSIVTPAFKEPLPGWVDNLNGPVGLMIGAAKGVIRSVHCNAQYHAEVIPVDFAINAVIAIGWKIGTTHERPEDIPVYNLTQSRTREITWGQILEEGRKVAHEYPFEMMMWYPDGNLRTSKFIHNLWVLFFHWIPAYLIDFMMLISGQKRFMLRIQRRIQDGLDVLQYFTTREWIFCNDKFISMRDSMNPVDKKIFSIDFEKVETTPYLTDCVLGARMYLMKEDPSSLPRCRRNLKILYVVDRSFKLLMFLLLAWLLISYYDTAQYLVRTAKDNFLTPIFTRKR